MRLITRGDFDGLVCAVLLKQVEDISAIELVHPKDAQDQRVKAGPRDIVANLPHIRGCGMWFDHHISENVSLPEESPGGTFELASSCADVIRTHYSKKGGENFERFNEMIEAAGRLDTANLLMDDILWPRGWILLGMTLDPRSGLGGGFEEYFRWLVEHVQTTPLMEVLAHPKVTQRADRLMLEQLQFSDVLRKHARQDGNVVVTDFRGLKYKPAGNRFLVYALFPDANAEVRVFDGRDGAVVVSVGRSITNRSCIANIGQFLRELGGGGHAGAGAVQFPAAGADKKIAAIIEWLKHHDNRLRALKWCKEYVKSLARPVTISTYVNRRTVKSKAELNFGVMLQFGKKKTRFSIQKVYISSRDAHRDAQKGAIETAKRLWLPECVEQAKHYAKYLRKHRIKCAVNKS